MTCAEPQQKICASAADLDNQKTQIYDRYDAYICGFSGDGNYFVLSDDGGISEEMQSIYTADIK